MTKTLDNYYKDAGKDYELEPYDRQSLDEIRKLLRENKYKDAAHLRDHMEMVENLIARLMRIIQDEEKESIANLSLKHDFARVKDLYDQMSRLLDQLESKQG
jgi:hypothetical protein